MLNDVRIGKIYFKDIEKVDPNINIKKVPLLELDESQNPLNSNRNLQRGQSNFSRPDKSFNDSFNKTQSESNLKTLVKTFFTYNMDSNCEPTDKISNKNKNYRNIKSA